MSDNFALVVLGMLWAFYFVGVILVVKDKRQERPEYALDKAGRR